MRRRKKPLSNASAFLASTLKPRIEALMDNRHRLLATFPIEPMELYQQFWTEEEANALELLQQRAGLIDSTCTVGVFSSPLQHNGMRVRANITVQLGAAHPDPQSPIDVTSLPVDMQAKIAEWIPYWLGFEREKNALLMKLEEVGRVCTTYGQIVRLWPDLEGFFDAAGRRTMELKAVQSPLPKRAFVYDSGQIVLAPGLRPEALAPFAETIAECLLLPEVSGIHTARVTLHVL